MPRLLLIPLVALLSAGCVDVTEPVGDIAKAQPNKKLLGEWKNSSGETFTIDRPDVKGNPKGLMRLTTLEADGTPSKRERPLWFFTAEVGNDTYANLLVPEKSEPGSSDLSKQGEYEKWAKRPTREYQIGRVVFDGDAFALDVGDQRAFKALMKQEKFEEVNGYYKVPPGWLAKYLEKNGPDALFHEEKPSRFTRVKK